MKAFLDQFAAILGAATVTVLLMSVCHEFGYFTLIGRHFQTLLSTTDYLANGVVFLPLAIFFAYGVQWSELELEPRPTRDWKKWRSWIWPTLIGLFFIFIAVTTPWPPYAFNMMYLMAVVIFAWSKIWPLVYRPVTSLGDDLNSVYRNTIRVGPPLAILLFLWGWINASTDLVRVDDPYLVKVKN